MKHPFLILDPDETYLEQLSQEKTDPIPSPLLISSRSEAKKILQDPVSNFSSIWINTSMLHPYALPLVHLSLTHKKTTPIYLFYDLKQPPRLNLIEITGSGVQQILQKPLSVSQMTAIVSPRTVQLNEAPSLTNPNKSLQEIKNFLEIKLTELEAGITSVYDLYLKSGDRYVKVLNRGDSLSTERLQSYEEKKVQTVFFPERQMNGYLEFCDQLIKKTEDDLHLSSSGGRDLLSHGEETIQYLRAHGVDESSLEMAQKVVGKMNEAIQKSPLRESQQVQNYLNNVAACEHGVGTAILASAMIAELDTEIPKTATTLGAFLHDLGLYELPAPFWTEDESKLTPIQQKIFQKHVETSREMLSPFLSPYPSVLDAIERHHERLGGKGFPKKSGATKVNKIAEIYGISDEFAHLIKKAAQNTEHIDPDQIMAAEILDGFSQPIQELFRMTFWLR